MSKFSELLNIINEQSVKVKWIVPDPNTSSMEKDSTKTNILKSVVNGWNSRNLESPYEIGIEYEVLFREGSISYQDEGISTDNFQLNINFTQSRGVTVAYDGEENKWATLVKRVHPELKFGFENLLKKILDKEVKIRKRIEDLSINEFKKLLNQLFLIIETSINTELSKRLGY